jgi:hypothetical protein
MEGRALARCSAHRPRIPRIGGRLAVIGRPIISCGSVRTYVIQVTVGINGALISVS